MDVKIICSSKLEGKCSYNERCDHAVAHKQSTFHYKDIDTCMNIINCCWNKSDKPRRCVPYKVEEI